MNKIFVYGNILVHQTEQWSKLTNVFVKQKIHHVTTIGNGGQTSDTFAISYRTVHLQQQWRIHLTIVYRNHRASTGV